MTSLLLLAFIFLLAGVVAVPIASRLGLGSVLGYLVAGIVISPALSLMQVDVVAIQHFAEFGVVMMLFLVGLELEPKRLWSLRTQLIGLGGGQVILTTALVMAAAMLLGQPWSIALAIGLVLALSSTAIVLQTLNEKGLMKSDGGQASFSVLLFQDIAVIPMLALIPLLALPELLDVLAHSGAHDEAHTSLSLVDGLPGWQTALITLSAIAAVVFGGNFLTGPVFRFVASARLRELFTATALMMVIGIALLMSLVGLSPALGTFLAGVVLANSEYRHELESDIDPFKGLLLGLFFITVGASINFQLLTENFLVIVALTLGLILLKSLVLLILARVFKIGGSDKWLFSLGLAQAGEFGFVLLTFTVANAVIPQAIADQLLLIVALSMLLTPALFIFYDRVLLPRLQKTQERAADEITESNHIIIAGHGRVGGIINRMLTASGHTATVIDYSSKQLEVIGKFGIRAYFGDATRPDLLHSAGIDQAKLLIIAIDNRAQITELVRYARKHCPELHIIARAVDRNHVYDLYAAGCRDIIRDTYDSSIRIGRSAFEALGINTDKANQMSQLFDQMDRRAMVTLAAYHEVGVDIHENDAYIAKAKEIGQTWRQELADEMQTILRQP